VPSQDLGDFEQLLQEYQDVFSLQGEPLGQTDAVHHEVKTTGPPIKTRYRRVPMGLREEAVKEEERMKSLHVIEPSQSPWAAPVVLVRKKDGSLRYCIDYRELNEVTYKDSYPLPNIQDCLESLDGAKYFSSMDLNSGYWQIPLSEDAKEKTAFYGAGGGLWRFTVMPFGLCNAPATFERLMERVLGQLQWHICLCYIDDVLVYSRTVNQHLTDLAAVLQRLRDAKLKLKPKKCHFFQRRLKFLGHFVSSDGVETDPEKIHKINASPAPRDLHELRSFLGLCSYYRRFMPHFSETAKPLIRLTEKNVTFHWGDAQDAAFRTLKEVLSQAPVLVHPRKEGQFILDTDASDEGIGAVLSQIQDGEEKVISYGSRALTKTERNYCITRRELLAVVHFTEMFRHFLLGRHFLVRTDNSAVRYWTKLHSTGYEAEGQVARWLVKLSVFDFEIKHRPGKQHGNADSLSRRPFICCAQCQIRHADAYESKRKKTLSSVQRVNQTTQLKTKFRENSVSTEMPPSCSHSGGAKRRRRKAERMVQDGLRNSDQVGKARAITRGRAPQARQDAKDATPSWLEGGVNLSKAVVRDEQLKDPAAVDALCWLQQGQKPGKDQILSAGVDTKFLWSNFDCLLVKDGVLYKQIGPLVDGSTQSTVYVPPSLRKESIRLCHDTQTAGHFYFWKTLNKLKKYFTWGGMSKDVHVYCQACHICATRKNAGRTPRAHMKRYDVGFPMEEVAIDLMGPFPESEAGNKYVLVIVDSFSKWMEAYPLPNIEAKTVAERFVLEFVSRFGVPYQIKTDRGRQFECELFKELCVLLEVNRKTSTPFHPQGNSRVERMVKVVGNLIAAFCQDYKQWDRHLPLLTLAYRCTIHEVTGFTPNFVMIGREVVLPLDVMMGVIPEEEKRGVPQYVQEVQRRLTTCFTEVRNHLKAYGERQRKYYNLSTNEKSFKPGDLVYLREKTRKIQVSPKLMPKWRGPYMVVKAFGTVFEILTGPKVSKLYHHDLLKACHLEQIPPWIKRARRRLAAPARDQSHA